MTPLRLPVFTLFNTSVRLRSIQFALMVSLSAGCAGQSPVKSVEMLDERTGMTMGAENAGLWTEEEIDEWNAAIAEYEALHGPIGEEK